MCLEEREGLCEACESWYARDIEAHGSGVLLVANFNYRGQVLLSIRKNIRDGRCGWRKTMDLPTQNPRRFPIQRIACG